MEYFKSKKEFFSEIDKVPIECYPEYFGITGKICERIPDKWFHDQNVSTFIMKLAERNLIGTTYGAFWYTFQRDDNDIIYKTLRQHHTFQNPDSIISFITKILNKYHRINWDIGRHIPEKILCDKTFIKTLINKTNGYVQEIYGHVLKNYPTQYAVQDDAEIVELLLKHRVYDCFDPHDNKNLRYMTTFLEHYSRQEYGYPNDIADNSYRLLSDYINSKTNDNHSVPDIPDIFIKHCMTEKLAKYIAQNSIDHMPLIPRKYKIKFAKYIILTMPYGEINKRINPKDCIAPYRIPISALNDREILLAAIKRGLSSANIPEEYRDDDQIGIECAIYSDIKCLSERIRNNRQIAQITVSQHWQGISHLTPNLQTYPEIFELMVTRYHEQDIYPSQYPIDNTLPLEYHFCHFEKAVNTMAKSITDKDTALRYMKDFPWMFESLPAKLRNDPDILDFAVKNCSIYVLERALTAKQKNTKSIAYRFITAEINRNKRYMNNTWDHIIHTFANNPIRHDVNRINEFIKKGVCDVSLNDFTNFIAPEIYTNPKFLKESSTIINPYWNNVPIKLRNAICSYAA